MKITSVILAGGRGERLYPITNTRPKPLCPVNGVTPLERCIELARECGAQSIKITAAYMFEKIKKAVERYDNVSVVVETKPLSTAGAVKNAKPEGDIIVVLCGDTLCDFDLSQAIKSHRESCAEVTIVTTPCTHPIDYGVVCTEKGCVSAFYEKPSWQNVYTNVINTGIYVISHRVLEQIPSDIPYDFGSELFPRLVREGYRINTCELLGYWCDMGTPRTYYEANMRATSRMSTINPNAVVDRTAKITRSVLYENVYVGKNSVLDGCIICENAKIGSDCLIPRGCIVGADSIIEDGAVFGDGIIVTNGVYIGKGVSVMKNVYSNEVKTRLFDSDLGVGGIYGANFDISDAVYLGQSLCTQQKKGERAKIGVMCGDNGFSRILAGVTIGGVRFGGGDCIDLGDGFLSLCAFSAREFLLDYAIFVDVDQEFDIAISVFDSEGLLLSREGQRRLERVFFRRGEAQSYPRDAETLEESQNPKSVYASALTALVKELAGFKLSIKTTNSPSEILREALNKCGADVKTNTDGDIFDLSDNGLYLSAVTKSGKKVSFWHFLCLALGESVKNGKSIVAIPQYAPLSLVRYI
ncbi:MAG: sugar phosphate nucleotidyltransferase [Clostridia bacterium]